MKNILSALNIHTQAATLGDFTTIKEKSISCLCVLYLIALFVMLTIQCVACVYCKM